MKYLLLPVICFIAFHIAKAQTDTAFQKQWLDIDSIIVKNNLPKTALKKVNAIYGEAKKQNNHPQIIKALLYKLSLEDKTTDEAINKSVAIWNKEIAEADDVVEKSILDVLLAETIKAYYSDLEWQIESRSTTTHFKKDDIETWSADDFYKYLSSLYKAALVPQQLLQQTNVKAYSAVIIKGNASFLRPTLYDLLANMALNFYESDNYEKNAGVNSFQITDTAALSGMQTFISYNFQSADTSSHLLKALQLFQQLLSFHAQKNDTAALIDANINRIEWVNNNAVFDDKPAHYKTALEDITAKYANHPQAAEAWYLLIKTIADKADGYKPFSDTTNRYAFVTARKMLIGRLTTQPAESEGNSNMQQLLHQIEQKTLHTEAENINVPNQPFRVLVQYKNVDTLYGRVISKSQFDKIRDSDNSWKLVASMPYIHSFIQPLPPGNDYQQHSVEIKMAGLPAGEYILLGSSTPSFNDSTGRLLIQSFQVSHLTAVNYGRDYFALDRETGNPLAGIKAIITEKIENGEKYPPVAPLVLTTDANGHFECSIKRVYNYDPLLINLIDGNDSLSLSRQYYTDYSVDNEIAAKTSNTDYERMHAALHLYTDRGIYRPGQKVFFKGSAITDDKVTRNPKLYYTTDSIKLFLINVNNKKIDSLSLHLNQFGSLSGSFTLPMQTLTGRFQINAEYMQGWAVFNVEEYKRPTFRVDFDTLKSTYRLKDTVTVTGFAQAFAGNNINGATVKFTVQRETRFTGYSWLTHYGNSTQVTQGQLITDVSGKFEIKFAALPDLSADSTTDPLFNFSVNASITDAGGETREANKTVTLGYRPIIIKIDAPSVAEAKSINSIPVSVQNLAGSPVDANVHVTIYPLLGPGRTVNKRYWDRPDMFVMSKDEFIKNFPYDEYENESDVHTWQKGASTVKDTFNYTSARPSFNLQSRTLPQGWYAIEATTTDKDGHDIKDIAYIEIYDDAKKDVPAFDASFSASSLKALHPGDEGSIIAGSGFKDVYIIQRTDKPSQKITATNSLNAYKFFTINAGKEYISESVTEADRGGFGIYYAFVKHNHFYSAGNKFDVPYDNKELNITYTTYRNKTEPGSKEQWSIHVSSKDSTHKPAELLTSMYDASLDEFAINTWSTPNIWPYYSSYNEWKENDFNTASSFENDLEESYYLFQKIYDALATQGSDLWNQSFILRNFDGGRIGIINEDGTKADVAADSVALYGKDGTEERLVTIAQGTPARRVMIDGKRFESYGNIGPMQADMNPYRGYSFALKGVAVEGAPPQAKYQYGEAFYNATIVHRENNHASSSPPLQLRTNFNETAFFFPQLQADSAGNYTIKFTMPESLTKWNWHTLAHTKDLSFGVNETTIITQKTLMVQPNMPRFLRSGDQLELTARISNTGDTAITGQASLELVDAETGNAVDGSFQNVFPVQYFTAEARQTTVVKFPVVIPTNYNKPVTYLVIARNAAFSDGEENTLPVLTNRILVTESLPLYIKGDTTKHFTFSKLLNNNSETLQTQSLTVEYTANPIWNAIQSLPYLIEYPYECAEQIFNRFYANALAANIVSRYPRIKELFQAWQKDTTALLSNLAKNPELKQIMLEETPWVLDAENETQQHKNMALLFDMVAMSTGQQSALKKLQDMQLANGGFTWFKGGYADRYITQYIITGIGRLQELNVIPKESVAGINDMVSKALTYLDEQENNDYNQLVKDKVNLTQNQLSNIDIQYLFMRSYFTGIAIDNKRAYNYYYQQAMQYWQQQSVYMQGMIALTLLRTNQAAFVIHHIYPSIIENAVATNDRGMYWKDNQWGYYWYQSPIEQQALLIELADAVASTKQLSSAATDADEMKTWLINQKQTTNWQTTKATADACFALMLHSDVQMHSTRSVTITLGDTKLANNPSEAGTGYFKQVLKGDDVEPAMGNITVSVQSQGTTEKNTSPSYGAVHWQYLEDMDNITQATTSLRLHKKLFVERTTPTGRVLTPLDADSVLHVGDKVIVRMELSTDRNLEYLHLKDLRAATMEPVDVLSEYKWQDGLGYYQSTRDAATDFFISYMPKGTYVFEYPVYITHIGTFSAGIATVQCMYAPQFTSHSEGLKITVE